MKMEARVPYGYYRHLFSQTDVDNSLYGYVKSDMEEHRLSYALSGNWQRSDPRLGIVRTIVDNPEFA
jgi:hypothetical protein